MEIKYDFDHILEFYVGGGGRWQLGQYACLLLQSMASSVPFLLHIFAAHVPAHRCAVPACEDGLTSKTNANSFDQDWLTLAIPQNAEGDGFLSEAHAWAQCERYARNVSRPVKYASACARTAVLKSTPCPQNSGSASTSRTTGAGWACGYIPLAAMASMPIAP